ncbi:hypothetical protein HPP92_001144 [Vanilla planifolia]|uniref:Protein kinase domain-containing protein n=1 Tax=Vanilla planifolia TaxID=51239 RepID=A0A835RTG0_VANPL|nr:hypothetical protein HPP92_001144 [Vanilla planifolia]
MDSHGSESSAYRPLLRSHDHRRSHGSSHAVMIVLPAIAAAVLVGCALVRILRRPKGSKRGFDETKLVSNCSSTEMLSFVGFSPDMRGCIYGGRRLGFSTQTTGRGGQVFTYRELEMATDGFNPRNVMTHAGFGILYKGTLMNGTLAAIKLLYVEGRQGEREFRMEVDLFSRLHSQYLVGLLGYCADGHHRLLVYEYMPNGCLQKLLHPTTCEADQPLRFLDWTKRLRIALDCARGLEFLHENSFPAVIHRDLNCSNILLDRDFRAKLSGFGLTKPCSDTLDGYAAPEYALTGKITTKSDVYSYGVVLLELLTGRVPVDTKRPQPEQLFISWALPRLTSREKIEEMVDPLLQGLYSKKELVQVAAIAAVCVQPEADYRPLITDVVQSLIPLVKSACKLSFSSG